MSSVVGRWIDSVRRISANTPPAAAVMDPKQVVSTFGTVRSVVPLRIALDNDPGTELPYAPPVVGTYPTQVGQRVYVQTWDRQVVIVGVLTAPAATDTGWQPHGGTIPAGVHWVGPLEWRILRGVVWWRGQVYRDGGWTGAGIGQVIATNLPAAVRPTRDGHLVGSGDLTWTQAVVNTEGEMSLWTGNTYSWPPIGGGYPLG